MTRQGSVLIVDDSEPNRDVLSRRLLRNGFLVETAADGDAALMLAGRRAFDVVLLDVEMPGMSGLEVLGRLRETRSQTELPVIMVTARAQGADIVEALQLGANDYVTKPIDFDLLTMIIEARLKAVARTGLWPKTVALNEREVEVLTWVARGKTSAEIAQILGLTKRTVDFHTDNARGKLGAATRTEAAIKAASGKLIEP